MSRYIFKLPDIGEGTAEAELVTWHIALGDVIEEDAPIADIMTDKATVELTSPVSGKVVALHGEIGAMSSVGSPLVEFETEGEAEVPVETPAAPEPTAVAAENAAPPPTAPPPPAQPPADRPRASPAVRKRAKDENVRLEDIPASEPGHRIRHRDLDIYLAMRSRFEGAGKQAALPPLPIGNADEYREVKLAGLRRKIAEKMEISARHIPHFSYVEEIDVTALEEARSQLNARYADSRPKLSFLPFFIAALCRVLPDFPQINALYDEANATARHFTPVHIGIATQTPNGLIVPVIRDAGRLGLWELATEITRLAAAARDNSAKREELSGSTITITSLGTLGGIATTPVINHPEVAIIGPNRIVERPAMFEGQVTIRKLMNLSSSFDHRVVDGYDAARFIQAIRALIEAPAALLAE